MRARLLIALVLVSVGVAAFLAGRGSVRSVPVEAADRGYHAGFVAGREAAFCCYDGGWGYGEPYIVTLRRGARGVTYRVVARFGGRQEEQRAAESTRGASSAETSTSPMPRRQGRAGG